MMRIADDELDRLAAQQRRGQPLMPPNYQFSVGELRLIIEALTYRAARHDTYARSPLQKHARTAGAHERKAAAMRQLRKRLMEQRHSSWP